MRTTIVSALLFLVGCDNTNTTNSDTSGNWWDAGSDSNSGDDDGDGDGDGDDDDDDDDDDEEDEVGQVFWGELETNEGWGAVGYFSVTENGVECDQEFPVTGFEVVNDCSDCSSAYSLTLGEGETFDEAGAGCSTSPYGDLSGTVFRFGVAGGVLYVDTGDGFKSVAGGFAEVEGTEVFFEIGSHEEDEEEE
ncbi:MAG: hypothetical protein AAFV53_02095 [Myxococcota bacterium]